MDSEKDSLSAMALSLLAGVGTGNIDLYKPETIGVRSIS